VRVVGGERWRLEIEEVGATAGGGATRQAGIEGQSDRGMKTHKEDEVTGRSRAPPIA
jgi:hypothetical protein